MCLGCRAIYQELGSLSRVTSFKKTSSQQPPTANCFSANMKLEGNSGKEGNGREGKGQNQRDRLDQSILYACMKFSNNKNKTFK